VAKLGKLAYLLWPLVSKELEPLEAVVYGFKEGPDSLGLIMDEMKMIYIPMVKRFGRRQASQTPYLLPV